MCHKQLPRQLRNLWIKACQAKQASKTFGARKKKKNGEEQRLRIEKINPCDKLTQN